MAVLPPLFPALGSRVRRLVYKLGTHHANSPYGWVSQKERNTMERRSRNLVPVFIASFLRYLHCGRYPWLWNDEHALVMPTVVGIGLLFCVLAMG